MAKAKDKAMIFGKYINKYYIKYAPSLLFGLLALITVDYLQLRIPELYRLVVNGINSGYAEVDGVLQPFTLDLLLDEVCLPLIFIILALTIGRFLWRICIFGAGIKVMRIAVAVGLIHPGAIRKLVGKPIGQQFGDRAVMCGDFVEAAAAEVRRSLVSDRQYVNKSAADVQNAIIRRYTPDSSV